MADYRILIVCLGNICRSPTAEAALRRGLEAAGLADRVEVNSAGTGAWHVGEPPDARMVEAGSGRGLDLAGRARQVAIEDFDAYDLILAMDRSNRDDLVAMAPDAAGVGDVADAASGRKVRLFREFDEAAESMDVPDPYYGGEDGFARVVDLVCAAADGVVAHVRRQIDA